MKDDTLYQMVYERILEQIASGTYPENSRLPSEKELTEEYFVSRITTKKALSLLSEKGYVKRIAGKGTFVTANMKKPEFLSRLSRPKTGIIGVILCNIDVSYGLNILLGIEEEASKNGYGIMFFRSYDSKQSESTLITKLLKMGAEGIIIQPVHGENYNFGIIELLTQNYPLALVDRDMDKVDIPFSGTHNFNAARDATFKLLEMGHKNLAFFSPTVQGTSTLEQRYYGIVDAFQKKGVALQLDTWVCDLKSPLNNNEENKENDICKIKACLLANPNITCVFASEMSIAMNVYQVCKDLNRCVPEAISIVCFDNIDSNMGIPFFAHIKQKQYEMGKSVCEMLLQNITDKPKREKVYLEAEFIVGETLCRRRSEGE